MLNKTNNQTNNSIIFNESHQMQMNTNHPSNNTNTNNFILNKNLNNVKINNRPKFK